LRDIDNLLNAIGSVFTAPGAYSIAAGGGNQRRIVIGKNGNPVAGIAWVEVCSVSWVSPFWRSPGQVVRAGLADPGSGDVSVGT